MGRVRVMLNPRAEEGNLGLHETQTNFDVPRDMRNTGASEASEPPMNARTTSESLKTLELPQYTAIRKHHHP